MNRGGKMSARKIHEKDTLAERFPHLAEELISHDPKIVHYGSRIKATWQCSQCSYTWTNTLWLRTKKNTKCPQCHPFKFISGINDLTTMYPKYAEEMISHDPTQIHYRSNKTVKWQCSTCQYQWKSKLVSRITYKTKCPQCSGKILVPGMNDIKTVAPEIIEEFSTRNILPAEQVKSKSIDKYWWQCSDCSWEWEASPFNRIHTQRKTGCPMCSQKSSKGEQELYETLLTLTEHTILRADRKQIAPYELDFLIPELHVGIEYNGNYWHNDENTLKRHNMTAYDYHTMKEKLCKNEKIELLYIWESDWNTNQEKIVKILEDFFATGTIDKELKKYEIQGE